MRTPLTLGLLASSLALVSSCSASFPTQATTPAVLADLRVRYPTLCARLMTGNLVFFNAYAVDSDGVYTEVTNQARWSASNPVVGVFPGPPGLASFTGAGTTELLASYQGFVGSLSVPVASQSFPFLEITLTSIPSTASARIRPGPTLADVGADVTTVATWTTSDANVATIQGSSVNLVAPGNVIVRASYNGISGACGISIPPRR